jgi:hypothetical protein
VGAEERKMRRRGTRRMNREINSYGFDGEAPVGARYGIYDPINGEWTGIFYRSISRARRETLSPYEVKEVDDPETEYPPAGRCKARGQEG